MILFITTGEYEVPVSSLCEPEERYQCRSIREAWVKVIKERLLTPGYLVSILPVLAVQPEGEEFTPDKVVQYTLYTLGGNHLRQALQMLMSERGNVYKHYQ